jgi:hypothetical protein
LGGAGFSGFDVPVHLLSTSGIGNSGQVVELEWKPLDLGAQVVLVDVRVDLLGDLRVAVPQETLS